MQFIDTHAHLDFPEYRDDLEEIIARSFKSGLVYIITVGAGFRHSVNAVNLAERYSKIFASVGIHPHEADRELDKVQELGKLAGNEKVVAIGETGLDYFRNLADKNNQKELFRWHIALALKIKKPLILHVRDAYSDTLEILEQDYLPKAGLDISAVVHCFSGTAVHAQRFLKAGLMISFTGSITYGDKGLEEAVKIVPLERIMLETDCPFLAPGKLRGQRNEPVGVIEVAKKIAQLKEVTLDKIAAQTTANATSFFKLS